MKLNCLNVLLVSLATAHSFSEAFVVSSYTPTVATRTTTSLCLENNRRSFIQQTAIATASAFLGGNAAIADDSFDVDNFLKTGGVAMPMGVSGQAGKGKPELGVVLRDGSEVSRDSRTGDVLAEILVEGKDGVTPVLTGFSSPWSLQAPDTVECRDFKTGDGAFLALSRPTQQSLEEVSPSFLYETVFSPTGRFSFYGEPTNVKVKKSTIDGDMRILEISFSTLSQSTQTEIPRNAILAATIPKGTQQVVMLVASSSASRWKKGSESTARNVISTFRAVPAPPTNLKVRPKAS